MTWRRRSRSFSNFVETGNRRSIGMTLTPLGARIVVRPSIPERQTASGLIIAETARGYTPTQGVVLAVGPGGFTDRGFRIPMEISVGDTVLFQEFGGAEIKHDGETVFLLEQAEVLAIL